MNLNRQLLLPVSISLCVLMLTVAQAEAVTVGTHLDPLGFNQPNITEMKWKSEVLEYESNADPQSGVIFARIDFNGASFQGAQGGTSVGFMIQNLLHRYQEGGCYMESITGGLELYFTIIDPDANQNILAGVRLDADPNGPLFKRIFQDIDLSGAVGNNIYATEAIGVPALSRPVTIEWHLKRGGQVSNPPGSIKRDITCQWVPLEGVFREWVIDVSIDNVNYPVATYYLPESHASFLTSWAPFALHQEHFGSCGPGLDLSKGEIQYSDFEVLSEGSQNWVPIPDWVLAFSYQWGCESPDSRFGAGTAIKDGEKVLTIRVGHENDISMKRCQECPFPDRVPFHGISLPPTGDEVIISNVSVSQQADSATISWNTSVPADGMVRYGSTKDYEYDSAWDPGPATSHSLQITVPTAENVLFRIESIDANSHKAIFDGNFVRAGNAWPDLMMTTVSGPASGVTGSDITVSDSAINLGTAGVASSIVGYYISTDATITKKDFFLGSRFVCCPGGGSTDSGSITAKVPAEIPAGSYFLGAIADIADDVAEDNTTHDAESNNAVKGSSITITNGPDLVMTSVTSPSSATVGIPFMVSDSILNQGSTGTGSQSAIGYFLSSDTTISRQDVSLGNRAVLISTPSTGYPILRKGPNGAVNYRLLLAPNDKVFFSFDSQEAGFPTLLSTGSLQRGTWNRITVTYDGTTVQMYLNGVADATAAGWGTPKSLGVQPLTLGREIDQNSWLRGRLDEVRIYNRALDPSEIGSGTSNGLVAFYRMDQANGAVVTDSSGLGNNGVNHGASVLPGQIGNGFNFDGQDDFVEVPDNPSIRLSSAMTLEAWVYVTPTYNVPAGTSQSGTATVIIPEGVPAGQYYFGAFADVYSHVVEGNEENNAKTAGSTLTVNGPDLTTTALTATLSETALVVSDVIKNEGGALASGPLDISFYLSTDTRYQGGVDTLICQRIVTTSLEPGGSSPSRKTASTACPIPASAPPGFYYVIANVDSGRTIAEINERNNTRATASPLAIGPDLVPTSISASISGNTLTLSDAVENLGYSAAGPFTIGFYLSLDTVLDGGDLLIQNCGRTVSGLAARSSDPEKGGTSVTCSVPAVSAGDYYVIVVDDLGDTVIETAESNNAKASRRTITLQ